MAYYVASDRLLDSFPEKCPYCAAHKATATFVQPFGKMTSKHSSETLRVELSACEKCARWFKRSRLYMFILGFSAPVALLGTLLLGISCGPRHHEAEVLEGGGFLTFLLIVGFIFSTIWRRWRFRLFRIAYFNRNGEVVYAGQDRDHMKRFAELNGLKAEEKLFLLRTV
ncbi:MAG: hypothetical protein JWO95_2654 [Verrucomicrobiales bacterium]|nr:hypothetical protein [Verrucomicrobiales bacterium]